MINRFGDLVASILNTSRDIFDTTLIGEFELQQNYWLHQKQLTASPLEAFECCDSNSFSSIFV